MRTPLIMEKISFLQGRLDPNTVDGGPDQPGPIYRTSIADYIVAEILRDISMNLKDQTLAAKLHSIGKELVSEASQGLVAGWDDGDDICPPWFVHFKRPQPPNPPDPNPWPQFFEPAASWLQHVTPAMNDIVLATAIRQLASLTTSERASSAMKQIGETIVKGASGRLFDEYCGTSVRPRLPGPKKEAKAA